MRSNAQQQSHCVVILMLPQCPKSCPAALKTVRDCLIVLCSCPPTFPRKSYRAAAATVMFRVIGIRIRAGVPPACLSLRSMRFDAIKSFPENGMQHLPKSTQARQTFPKTARKCRKEGASQQSDVSLTPPKTAAPHQPASGTCTTPHRSLGRGASGRRSVCTPLHPTVPRQTPSTVHD